MSAAGRRALTLASLVGLLAVGLLVLAGPSQGQVQPADDAEAAALEVFQSQCAPCHGDRGEGADVGPPLTALTSSLEEREALITNGRGAMPAFVAVLAAAEISDLAALMDTLATADVYATQCAPCHGADGEGGIGPSLFALRTSVEEQVAVISEGLGAMPAFATTLDSDQIETLVDFTTRFSATNIAGQQLYAAQCAPCHGADGEGGVGTELQSSLLATDELVAVIAFGAGTMPTFGGTLTPDEIDAVARFTESLRVAPPPPVEEPAPDAAARGAQVYAEQCAGCHGADGEGGAGPPVAGSTLSRSDITEVIAAGAGSMPGFEASLSESDIDDIATWLLGGVAPDPEQIALLSAGAAVYTENCAICHGVDASGGSGPSLNTTTLTPQEVALIITSGVGTMPGFEDSLSEDDVTALTVYIEAAVAATTPQGAAPVAFTPDQGQSVFVANCATCHGPDAAGGLAPGLTFGDLTANEIISQVYGGHAQGMPAFEGVLSANQVQQVARYIIELPQTSRDRITGGLLALIIGLIVVVVVGGLWAAGRIGTPVSDADFDEPPAPGASAWEPPLPPPSGGEPPPGD